MTRQWNCSKCSSSRYETDKIAVTGSGLSKFFDVQNRRFTAVTCQQCGFTEFYRADKSTGSDVLDFLFGG